MSEEWRSLGKHIAFVETRQMNFCFPTKRIPYYNLNYTKEENNVSAPRIASSKCFVIYM